MALILILAILSVIEIGRNIIHGIAYLYVVSPRPPSKEEGRQLERPLWNGILTVLAVLLVAEIVQQFLLAVGS